MVGLLSDDGPFERHRGTSNEATTTWAGSIVTLARRRRAGRPTVARGARVRSTSVPLLQRLRDRARRDQRARRRSRARKRRSWIYRLTSGLGPRVAVRRDPRAEERAATQLIGASDGEPSVIADLLGRSVSSLQTGHRRAGRSATRRWGKARRSRSKTPTNGSRAAPGGSQGVRAIRAGRIEIALGLKPLWVGATARGGGSIEVQRLRFDGAPRRATSHSRSLEALQCVRRRRAPAPQRDVRARPTSAGPRGDRRSSSMNEVLGPLLLPARRAGRTAGMARRVGASQSEELTESVERLDARVESEAARLAKLWRHKPDPEAAPEPRRRGRSTRSCRRRPKSVRRGGAGSSPSARRELERDACATSVQLRVADGVGSHVEREARPAERHRGRRATLVSHAPPPA